MDSTQTLHDFVLNLLTNTEARSAFQLDPEGALNEAGLGDITAADVQDVVPLVVDYAGIQGGAGLAAVGTDLGAGAVGAVPTDVIGQLQAVTQLATGAQSPSLDGNLAAAGAIAVDPTGLSAVATGWGGVGVATGQSGIQAEVYGGQDVAATLDSGVVEQVAADPGGAVDSVLADPLGTAGGLTGGTPVEGALGTADGLTGDLTGGLTGGLTGDLTGGLTGGTSGDGVLGTADGVLGTTDGVLGTADGLLGGGGATASGGVTSQLDDPTDLIGDVTGTATGALDTTGDGSSLAGNVTGTVDGTLDGVGVGGLLGGGEANGSGSAGGSTDTGGLLDDATDILF
ncbi:MAG: hypothetical protein GEV12_03770 [Micromonosporaceae bacterium]|nr:hypothetical protein [Micromonosporaceae bacterium]